MSASPTNRCAIAGDGGLVLRSRWSSPPGFLESAAVLFAPLSLLAPTFAMSIVANGVSAAAFLGERIESRGWWAIALIVLGTSLTSVSGAHNSDNLTTSETVRLLTQRRSMVYFAGVLGICGISASVRCLRVGQTAWLNALLYANAAGCAGGNQTLLLKCTMGIVANACRTPGVGQWGAVAGWGTLTFALGTVQLAVLNEGLSRHAAVSYLATYKSLPTVYGCVAGDVVFEELDASTASQWVAFPGSVLIVIAGLLALPSGREVRAVGTTSAATDGECGGGGGGGGGGQESPPLALGSSMEEEDHDQLQPQLQLQLCARTCAAGQGPCFNTPRRHARRMHHSQHHVASGSVNLQRNCLC